MKNKEKMKAALKKVGEKLSPIYGYGIMISLFLGGLSFVGYLVALIVGGNVAETICTIIYKYIYPYLVYGTSVFVLFGLIIMYLKGEKALTANKKKATDKPSNEEKEENKTEKAVEETVQQTENIEDNATSV